MSAISPAHQLPKQDGGYLSEGLIAVDRSVILTPSLNDRVEAVNESLLRRSSMHVDYLPETIHMTFNAINTGGDQGLVASFSPVFSNRKSRYIN